MHLFYVPCLRLVKVCGAFVLCATPGAHHCARGIYFMYCTWGSSLHSRHLICVSCLGLIVAPGAFIFYAVPGAHCHPQGIYFTIMWVGPKHARFLKIMRDLLIIIRGVPLCVGSVLLLWKVQRSFNAIWRIFIMHGLFVWRL